MKKTLTWTTPLLNDNQGGRVNEPSTRNLTLVSKWLLLAVAVGVVAGLGAILFQVLTQLVAHYALAGLAGFQVGEPHGEHAFFAETDKPFSPWVLVGVCVVGGLASGCLVYSLAPEAEGHGTDSVIDSFHNKGGFVRSRIPFIKTIASAITIGTGGSGGREGPIAQIGSGFGSFLATRLKMSARDRRIMLAAGMGAGVGAIFRAPLAGALFAAEILYCEAEFEADVIVPAAMASITAYMVYCLSLPPDIRFQPLFGDGIKHSLSSLAETLPYAAMALVLVLGAAIYVKTFYAVSHGFKKLPGPPHIRPAMGAPLTALAGIGLWWAFDKNEHALAVLTTGYGTLQATLLDATQIGVPLLLAIAGVKILTTSFTIGSGGVFGPSMVIGGCLGAAVGVAFHDVWPSVVPRPEPFALVGMAGFFAGAANAPISTIIMVSEMTGDYSLLLPTTLCSTLCFVLCRRWKLYEKKQVPGRLESPAHRGDFIIDLLEGIKVAEVFRSDLRLTHIPENLSLEKIVHRIAENHQHYYPVDDTDGRMVGIFSADDVREYLYNDSIWKLADANDVMVPNYLYVTPEDDLNTALERFTQLNIDELPVIDNPESRQLLGMLRRKETIAFYNRRLIEQRRLQQDDS
ncbi:chloride channel protein [Crateriforma conspicua]|uniref:H(+)/Cl(-) exchange transporter ClcA n=1 Tax=Crateriforma conspicua TaxID=2527996 RepID=A0A5C5XRE2_9PLAN|nr:chloride channel protein [Crateriforma conspicua]TWT65460.1 H(+)/Cl(-) exchange transporter ClcA [Crateriforma conspicua]